MLEFRDVSFKYDSDDSVLFEDFSFEVQKGEFVAIIGASGSGKSTIYRLVNRFVKPFSGEILVDKKNINDSRPNLGFMPQSDLLFPWRTVEGNVQIPLMVTKTKKKDRIRISDELLERVGLSDVRKKYPRELSGGMRQRVAFARTLATGADLLLLDEPFSALDAITRATMQEWLVSQWRELDKTIVFVTHDVEEAIFLSRRILVLTGRPVKKAIDVSVPLPEERSREMLLLPEIVELKQKLADILRQEAEQ